MDLTAPVYVIGDSHCFIFSAPGFSVEHIGPTLAWSLTHPCDGRDRFLGALSRVPVGSAVLAVFGEIDCRAHLYNQARRQKRPIKEIVRQCATRYADALKEAEEAGYIMIAFGVIPPTSQRVRSPKWPAAGTLEERREIVFRFNLVLGVRVRMVNLWTDLMNPDGTTREEYYRDAIHLDKAKCLPLARAKIEALLNKKRAA